MFIDGNAFGLFVGHDRIYSRLIYLARISIREI